MKIISIIDQTRRDFRANIECEICGHQDVLSNGYDDRNYHDKILPAIKCKNCGKSRNDAGIKGDFTKTRYAEYEVI